MNCSNCKGEAILNHANFKEFWYCRACKVEVFAEEKKVERMSKEYAAYDMSGKVQRLTKEHPCGEITLPPGVEIDVVQLANLPDDLL